MFYSLHPLRGRNVFALLAMSCLCMALLFTGCESEPDDEFVDDHKLNKKLVNIWTDSLAGDSYTITANHLSYGYGSDFISYAGTIVYVSNFTETAGVIIIKYDEDCKPTYYAAGHWGEAEHILSLKGDYIGVYYKNLKSGSVEIGGAYVDGGAEKATLEAAKKAFTMGYEGTYIAAYGAYIKQ